MQINEIIIWKDLSNQTGICTPEEAIKLISNPNPNRNSLFVVIDIFIHDDIFIDQVFSYTPIDKSLYNKKYFIISDKMQSQIENFINTNNLTNQYKTIYKIIALINAELASWHWVLNNKQKEIKDFETIKKEEKALLEAIDLHQSIYNSIDESKIKDEIQYFSIQFSRGKIIKISNYFLKNRIMNCLHDSYKVIENIDEMKFKKGLTKFKQLTSKGLFNFFRLKTTNWYTPKKHGVYKNIVIIFSFAGLETNFEMVETWVKRAAKLAS